MTDEEIMGRLTPSQRSALRAARPRLGERGLFLLVYRDMGRLAQSLQDLGLVGRHGGKITPQGLRIRKLIGGVT